MDSRNCKGERKRHPMFLREIIGNLKTILDTPINPASLQDELAKVIFFFDTDFQARNSSRQRQENNIHHNAKVTEFEINDASNFILYICGNLKPNENVG